MHRSILSTSAVALLAIASLALAAPVLAESPKAEEDEKHVSGMSILGNDESPKSLVIVPWKSSDLGDDLDLTRRFGQDRSALDPDVFRRNLEYHEIRTGDPAR
ncbi:MAG: hypothetical protein AAGC67_01690 [Myxococcota bacterium]